MSNGRRTRAERERGRVRAEIGAEIDINKKRALMIRRKSDLMELSLATFRFARTWALRKLCRNPR